MSLAPSLAQSFPLIVLSLTLACSDGGGDGSTDDGNSTSDGGTADGGSAEPDLCQHDISAWHASLFYATAQAADDGVIDYDPAGVALTRRLGTADAQAGEFSVTDTYIEDHKYTGGAHGGQFGVDDDGTSWMNYTSTYDDVLGESFSFEREIEQQGCLGEATITNLGDPGGLEETYTWYTEIVSADELVELLEVYWNDLLWVEERHSYSDLTTDYSIDIGGGAYVLTGSYNADGTHERLMVQDNDDAYTESDYLYQLDGSYHLLRESSTAKGKDLIFVLDAVYQYDGSALGTYTFYEKDVEVDCIYERDANAEWDCGYSYDCDNGELYEGEC